MDDLEHSGHPPAGSPDRPDPAQESAPATTGTDATTGSATGTTSGTASDYVPDPNRWRALTVTLVAGFMTLLDVSIVSVALPSIRDGLHASAASVQWVVSGYALSFGLVLVPAGRLGDSWGRRRMFLASLAGFVICSGLVGIAPNPFLLAVFRVLQGVAAGALAPQNSALIQQLFRGDERGRAFGFFGATVGLSTAIGPVVGGVILALVGPTLGWRFLFYLNLPIGIVALVLAARLIPKQEGAGRRRIDTVGAVLLGLAVFAALLPFVEADSGGLRRLWWMFLAVPVLGLAFTRWERRTVARGHEPLFDPRVVTRTPGYASGALLGSIYFVGFSGIWLVFAFYFQLGLGYSPLLSGLSVTAFALGSSVSAVIGGRLVARLGRLLTVIGLGMVVVGLAATALVLGLGSTRYAGPQIALPMLVAGIGGGWVISPNVTMTLKNVPVDLAGTAGGALQTGQRLGAAMGSAALSGIFYAVLGAGGHDFQRAVLVALGAAVVTLLLTWVIAVVEWRRTAEA